MVLLQACFAFVLFSVKFALQKVDFLFVSVQLVSHNSHFLPLHCHRIPGGFNSGFHLIAFLLTLVFLKGKLFFNSRPLPLLLPRSKLTAICLGNATFIVQNLDSILTFLFLCCCPSWCCLILFKGIWVLFNLPFDCVNMLLSVSVRHSDAVEDFAHFAKRIYWAYVIPLLIEESLSKFLDFRLFFLTVTRIVDSSSILQRVVHRKLLLQIPDFFLVTFDLKSRVKHQIHRCLVLNLHHSGGKLQSWLCFFKVAILRPNIGNHYRLTIASKRISEVVCELGLSVRDVVSLFVTQSENHLFKEGQRLVNELRFFQNYSLRVGLLRAFTASQVNKMQLGENYFVSRLNSWSAFNMECEDRMCTWRCFVHWVTSHTPGQFSFKEAI